MNRLLTLAFGMVAALALIAAAMGGAGARHATQTADAPLAAPPHNPWGVVATASADTPAASNPGEALVIARDGGGQFRVDGQVDGGDARFVVDTGADTVALTEADAERLGIAVNDEDFQPIVRSASGAGYGARVRLDHLVVAGQELDDVPAVVVRGLSVNLLGQSALRRLGRVELRGDRMVIVPG